MIPGDKIQKKYSKIEKNITESEKFFKNMKTTFHQSRYFLYKTTLSDADMSLLSSLQKPQLQFNILTSHISRLVGEFIDNTPGIEVGMDNEELITPEAIKNNEIIEGHIRHILNSKEHYSRESNIYSDILDGGFSAGKVLPEYKQGTFDYEIVYTKISDPTSVGFDPLAIEPDKSDGNFWYQQYPMRASDVKKKYGVEVDDLDSYGNIENCFNWSYKGMNNELIATVVEYYERKKIKKKLYKLANGKSMYKEQYEKHLEEWNNSNLIEVPSAIINERYDTVDVLCRYVVIKNKIVEYVKTDFKYSPFVFFPGNNKRVKSSNSMSFEEIAHSYIWNAIDAQRMKNFAGQTWINDVENMIQHKFVVPREAIPDEDDYREAYRNVQLANTLVYNGFLEDYPETQVPPPTSINRPQLPPEVIQAYTSADTTIQAILGSYDAALGINNNQLSGKAIIEGAAHSNAAAGPYVQGYLCGLNRVAQNCLDLIIKYFIYPVNIPTIDKNGKKSYQKLSLPENISEYGLNIKVTPGANFSLQKDRAISQIEGLARSMPGFGNFIQEKCMPIIMDNLDFRGAEKMKEFAVEYQQEMQQKMQQASQQPNPVAAKIQNESQKLQLEQAKLQSQQQNEAVESQLRAEELRISDKEADNERMKILTQLQIEKDNSAVQMNKSMTEREVHAHRMALDAIDMKHSHMHDKAKLVKELNKDFKNI